MNMRVDNYFVYILTNQRKTVLHVGSTDNLPRRMMEHERRALYHFTKRYNTNKLIQTEAFPDRASAVRRERQLKWCRRNKKDALTAKLNPSWADLRSQATR